MKIALTILVVVLGVPNLVTPVIGQAPQGKTTVPASNAAASYVRLQQPEMFTYEELVTLGTTDTVSGALGDKLHTITTTPFVSNEAYYRGATPHRPVLKPTGTIAPGCDLEHRTRAGTGCDQAAVRQYRGIPETGSAQ